MHTAVTYGSKMVVFGGFDTGYNVSFYSAIRTTAESTSNEVGDGERKKERKKNFSKFVWKEARVREVTHNVFFFYSDSTSIEVSDNGKKKQGKKGV